MNDNMAWVEFQGKHVVGVSYMMPPKLMFSAALCNGCHTPYDESILCPQCRGTIHEQAKLATKQFNDAGIPATLDYLVHILTKIVTTYGMDVHK